MLKSLRRIKKEKENPLVPSVLYAVFEKETEKFLGVGNFTSAEMKALENKYVFSKI